MGETVLEIKQLTKEIRGKKIVDDLSLSVQRGEIYGLLGPNGAGKTTTIRMIVGLITKSKGKVIVDGIDTDSEFAKAMTQIGAIVENPEMYKFLTGYQNLIHFARMTKMNIPKQRLDEVVKLVDLENVIHKKVKTYSLGMRQRLGVAQAILHKPALLILDEPTNGLDPQGIHEFRAYLRKLTEEGTSVIVSSHLLSEMQLMCDRVAIIQKGRLINVSTIHDMTNSDSKQLSVRFIVSDLEKAEAIVKDTIPEIETSRQDGDLQVLVNYDDIPLINQALVNGNVGVFGIVSKQHTLEERFLELTKEGIAQ